MVPTFVGRVTQSWGMRVIPMKIPMKEEIPKMSLPVPNNFCWIGWCQSKQIMQNDHLTINKFITQTGASVAHGIIIQSHFLMATTSLFTHCWEMSVIVVVLVTVSQTARPNWSHKCLMGLRSRLLAGLFILSTNKFWKWSLINRSQCGEFEVCGYGEMQKLIWISLCLQMWQSGLLGSYLRVYLCQRGFGKCCCSSHKCTFHTSTS